jgi:protein-tyrosine phosphatase
VVREIKRIGAEKYDPSKVDYFLNELYPDENISVPDPWYGEEPGYHEAYQIIDRVCDAIIQKYAPASVNK